jgi:hypothetical protein
MRRGLLTRGAPWPTKHAPDAPPRTVTLMLHEEAALRRIRKAGSNGVVLGDGVTTTMAIRIALTGAASIDRGSPQRIRARVHGVSK